MRLRGGLAVRRTIGVGVPDGCRSAARWSPLGVRIAEESEELAMSDRPAGDFRASAVRTSRGAPTGWV